MRAVQQTAATSMRMSFGLEAKQAQLQKLAPRMIQSMEILQLPIIALQERIDQEMNDNPMLEVEDVDPNLPDEEADEKQSPITEDEKELIVDERHALAADFERLANMDNDMPDRFDDFRRSSNRIQEDEDRQNDLMANTASRPESLNDFLLHQLAELDIDSDIEAIAERIISSLDASDGGYFKMPLADLLPKDHTKADLEKANEALRIVQGLEPTGIAARDLQECLLLQIRGDEPLAEPMRVLITKHLDDLAENRLPTIVKKTGFSVELIHDVKEAIHHLNPKPGAKFMEVIVPMVTPDIYIDQDDDGKYVVRIEERDLPPLRISPYYAQRLANPNATDEEREFIRKKILSAQWLIDAITQRRTTLRKVTEAIINHQTKFLDEGPEFLEPLKMQQIADQVGVHLTTISRAVDDKWVQTPRGIFPLKRFFAAGVKSEDGDDVAWDAIRLKLQEIFEKEDKEHPLSDDDLVNELRKHGLVVARRTMTKYRKKMGIPSSRQRKHWSTKDMS